MHLHTHVRYQTFFGKQYILYSCINVAATLTCCDNQFYLMFYANMIVMFAYTELK